MSALAGLLTAGAVFLLVRRRGRPALGDRLTAYLGSATRPPAPAARPAFAADLVARLAPAGAGVAAGWLLGTGSLFLPAAGANRPWLAVAGGAAGLLARRIRVRHRADSRARRLQRELPTVADTMALSVLAGDSVAGAAARFAASSRGVAAEELAAVVADHHSGRGLNEALSAAAGRSAHPEAARLFELLGHAHRTGGRLAEALGELAVDYRAALARDLTAEGGRRALASYGPILALMVPVTLLFLMYPTLTGLAALSSATG